MKNHEADPDKGLLVKSIFKLNDQLAAMPIAWELNFSLIN